jgi:asparagine synthase (glutamine-hydrolysing)
VLDGFGGDATVPSGYAYLDELTKTGRWLTLVRELRALAGHCERPTRDFVRHYAWRVGVRALVPDRVLARRRARRDPAAALGAVALLDPAFARRTDAAARVREQERHAPERRLTARARQHADVQYGRHTSALEAMDHAAAAFGVEPRYPFFDRRVVEFSLATPSDQKFRDGWSRSLIRRGIGDRLPETVRWRLDKGDYGATFDRKLRELDGVRLRRVALEPNQELDAYVDPAAFRRSYHRFVHEGADAESLALWRVVTLARWLRR